MKSEQLNELFDALAKAQAEMTFAQKDSQNPHLKSKYAGLASVWNAVREPLSKNGLSIVQMPNGDTLETILGHKSGQWISGETPIKSIKNDAQGYGSGLTYARRYALASIAGIAQDDDDGNGACELQPRYDYQTRTPECSVQPPATATAAQATEAMKNAQKQEATEDQKRAAFADAIKAACVRIGVERILEVVQSHGYDDPDQVQPKDFRPIVNAIKEIEAQPQQ